MARTPRRIRIVASPLMLAVALGLLGRDVLLDEEGDHGVDSSGHGREPVTQGARTEQVEAAR